MKTPKKTDAAAEAARIKARDDAALGRVAEMDDPDKLRALMANARRLEVPEVYDAAFRRLAVVQGEGEEGSAERDMWSAINAIEEIKRIEAGRTVRLSYLRRDIAKLGMVPAMDKLVSKPGASERFEELIGQGHPGLTAEAVVLRHAGRFGADAVARSRERLEGAGLDPAEFEAA